MTASVVLKFPVFSITEFRPLDRQIPKNHPSNSVKTYLYLKTPRFPRQLKARTTLMEAAQSGSSVNTSTNASMKLLFVEMGVGYDQHGQDITSAAMRACRDAISSNSIPAFRRGSIPGVASGQMKLQIKLGVPHSLQQSLDIQRVKSVFPYGEIVKFEVVDGGMICSSGVLIEEMGDENDDCYIVNAAVYVGY
ncbi:50S RIBOSOMAL PROTEIN L34 [Salix viminalis]|uniref:50S RIBOSOMAL PROTEIN L34 n=2 Tax=Salix TaxID=40685 RepID=A0A9Q0ZBQ1_9ROSI|nr:50S RIBOSOMAL PROTEIN L34 [Salix viminalis]KAJ6728502.1 50S RIBOSOMAL PROTEIN L34 [Salix koriyanagi]